MPALIKKLLGDNPKTSILGILVAALGIAHASLQAGEQIDWVAIINSVLLGLLGLKASDGAKK